MEKAIWTPDLYGKYDFGIYLDRKFALEMINSIIPGERQKSMNELATEELKRLGVKWPNPYTFCNNSCFITQFYIGDNGVWLSTNHTNISDLLSGRESSELVEYHSHNVDTPYQTYILMLLFNKWIDFSDALRDKR